MSMRGLVNFIKEVRECPNKQAERDRVKVELAKFQQVFQSSMQMGSYQRKKYVAKILYIFMLGYKVDIGRKEAVQLCGAKKFSEKQMGYLAVGVLIHEGHDLIGQLIDILKRDLESPNYEVQGLAVTCIANIGGRRLAQEFGETVANILMTQNSTTALKKKSAMCLLRIFRQHYDLVPPEFLTVKLQQLLNFFHLGLLTSVITLLMGMVQIADDLLPFADFVPKVLEILHQMVIGYVPSAKTLHYEYFGVPNPWLQVTLLRFLAQFPIPEDESLRLRWVAIVTHLLNEKRVQTQDETSRYLTAKNSVLMEVFTLAVKLGTELELQQTMTLIKEFFEAESSTLKILALLKLDKLLKINKNLAKYAAQHYKLIKTFLSAPDRAVRIKTIEILSNICGSENTNEIVQEFLKILTVSTDHSLFPVIVTKLISLAESSAVHNARWYVEVVIRVITLAGELVPEPNISNLISVVRSDESLQDHAVRLLIQFTSDPNSIKHSDSLTILAAILIRFYGAKVASESGCGPIEQFTLLGYDFSNRSDKAKYEVVETLKVLGRTHAVLQQTIDNFYQSYDVSTIVNNRSLAEPSPILASAGLQPDPLELSPFSPPDSDEYRVLCSSAQGLLCQNEHLQIGIITATEGPLFNLTIYYGNLSNLVLSNINVAVNNPDMNALIFNAQQPPALLNPQEQLSQQVSVTCCKEFVGAPQLNLSYIASDGIQYSICCHLPIISTVFASAFPVTAHDFLVAWGQVAANTPQEFQVMWPTTKGLDIQRAAQILESTLHFTLIPDVDPNPGNRVGACAFLTSTQKIPALCRLETDPATNYFRVTVKSFSPILSASLADIIKFAIN